MKSRDELERENEVLQRENGVLAGRIATLSAAVLRLGSTLDLPVVLQEAADSARMSVHTLTASRPASGIGPFDAPAPERTGAALHPAPAFRKGGAPRGRGAEPPGRRRRIAWLTSG